MAAGEGDTGYAGQVSTVFSHELRILSCKNCMAPFEVAIEGGLIKCDYCGATSQLSRRDEGEVDGSHADLSESMSQSERYAILAKQDIPGAVHPSIYGLLVDGQLASANIPTAKKNWGQAHNMRFDSANPQDLEGYFQLTVLLAPYMEERARRAMLESALEDLSESSHRHILRCMLAREAARLGELSASDAWLNTVDKHSTNLPMHTAYVFAAATLASAREDYERVTQLLGRGATDVPLGDRDEIACSILRVDALDCLGFEEEAQKEVSAWIEKWGAKRVELAIGHHRPLALCKRVFPAAHLRIHQARTAGLAHQLEGLSMSYAWSLNSIAFLLATTVSACVLAAFWFYAVSDNAGYLRVLLVTTPLAALYWGTDFYRSQQKRVMQREKKRLELENAKSLGMWC